MSSIISDNEIANIDNRLEEMLKSLDGYSQEKILFEKERCKQILNKNIPMCLSNYIKVILQSDDKDKILKQLHRINLETYLKLSYIKYLKEIDEKINKFNEKDKAN